MPRPRKQKLICSLPPCNTFAPCGSNGSENEAVLMSLEEYETIRLIDLNDMDQAQCAEEMGVARSTVQRLYMDARRKIAGCIVEGRMLKISGGDYTLCAKRKDPSKCEGCRRHRERHGQS
jgi:predicted DNA-binding protein (UPF0251 family)